jgi:hypothetical protein
VRKSWATGPSGDVKFVEPETWLFDAGDWDRVEAAIGTRLPGDYKELVGDGYACVLDEELFVASPFDPNPNVNLVMFSARVACGLAELRHDLPDDYPYVIYPEAGGWLCWGMDGGGGMYHWDTTDPDPDHWPVCIEGRPLAPHVQRHDLSLTSYLEALSAGTIKAAALADWPRPSPKIERRIARSGE